MQKNTFSEVLAVWKTYSNVYPNCEPTLLELSTFVAEASEASADTIWVIFSIVDKGIGITGPDLKKLGTAFTQLSSGRQKKYQGWPFASKYCAACYCRHRF